MTTEKRQRRRTVPGATNPFEPTAPKDAARYAEADATIRRDHEHGRLRITGPGLCYWIVHTPACDLKTWVLAELDRRIESRGWSYTSVGWVPSGYVDVGERDFGGVRIVGRVGVGAGEVDRAAITAIETETGWRLAVPEAFGPDVLR